MHDKFLFQDYLVVSVDLLGQREALRKMTGIPTSDSEKHKFIETTKDSLGKVLYIRDSFKTYFDAAREQNPASTTRPQALPSPQTSPGRSLT